MTNNHLISILLSIILLAAQDLSFCQNLNPYLDVTRPLEERVEDALSRMTLEEKVALIHADRSYGAAGVPRLGIPENNLTDGPSGLRPEMVWQTWEHAGISSDSCTAYPALICLAATWNPEMGYLFGSSYSEEALYRNKNMILGPGVNIVRTPMNGRNFEYLGEDPFLSSKMAVSYIRGVQSNHVSACVKHFAANNQEYQRFSINAVVDERTLNEIYFPAFKASVKDGGVWAVMAAYNKLNGEHCCQNYDLLHKTLKEDWGFDGVVVSDFGGTHDTEKAVNSGLDLEMGTDLGSIEAFKNYHMGNMYLELLKSGKADINVLDDKVRRVLRMIFRTSMSGDRKWGSLASEQHLDDSRRIASEGIVLLKNDGDVLPIDLSKVRKILVVGDNAIRNTTRGGGSSEVNSKIEISPLEGIRRRVDGKAAVTWQPGYSIDGNLDSLREEAVNAAKDADIVIFIGGLNKYIDCEGVDRKSYDLPYEQNLLLPALAEANKNTIAVMVSGNSYSMPWRNSIPAIVQAWYGGSEFGNAVASILFGDVNPSGKLPITFYEKVEDCGANNIGEYPGDGKEVRYKDGIFVGYRWLDKEGIEPLFPFGYGLSYTKYKFGKPVFENKKITQNDSLRFFLKIKNVGHVYGGEVVQVYVNDVSCSVPRPIKELKSFKKVFLQPGEEKTISFSLGADSLAYYDINRHDWVVEPGEFKILIGTSSRDINFEIPIEITENED
jgi:beta-glucosidase